MRGTKRRARVHRSKPCGWYQIYFAAVLETDQNRALVKIERAQQAMRARLVELKRIPLQDSIEVQDLDSALTYLRILLASVDCQPDTFQWN